MKNKFSENIEAAFFAFGRWVKKVALAVGR
jgi:hypothetical protein